MHLTSNRYSAKRLAASLLMLVCAAACSTSESTTNGDEQTEERDDDDDQGDGGKRDSTSSDTTDPSGGDTYADDTREVDGGERTDDTGTEVEGDDRETDGTGGGDTDDDPEADDPDAGVELGTNRDETLDPPEEEQASMVEPPWVIIEGPGQSAQEPIVYTPPTVPRGDCGASTIGRNESITEALAAADGNIFVKCSNNTVEKRDTAWDLLWSVGGLGNSALEYALDPSGGIIVAERPSHSEVSVSRFDAAGTTLWNEIWTAASGVYPIAVRLVGDDVFVLGGAGGQVPGNPSNLAGGHWIAQYDGNTGERLRLQQYSFSPLPTELYAFEAFERQDTIAFYLNYIGAAPPPGPPPADTQESEDESSSPSSAPWIVERFGAGRVEELEGVFSRCRSSHAVVTRTPDQQLIMLGVNFDKFCLGRLNIDEAHNETWTWLAHSEEPRTVVLDPVEGAEWTGSFDANTIYSRPSVLVSQDGIYVLGGYSNTYRYGANPKPNTNPSFIARYTLEGERVWFQQVLVTSNSRHSGGILVMPTNGELFALLGNTYLLRVDPEDGSFIE